MASPVFDWATIVSESSLSGVLKSGSANGIERGPRFAVADVAAPHWNLRQVVMAAEEVGLEAVGLGYEKLQREPTTEGIAALHESALAVSSLDLRNGFTGSSGQTFEESVNEGWSGLRLAGLVGAKTLLVSSGGRGVHIRSHARRLLVDGLRALAHEAGDCQVDVALVPLHPGMGDNECFLESLDDAIEVVGACDHPRIGLAFDAHHLWFAPQTLEDVHAIAPITHMVRLADWMLPPEASLAGELPGDGRLPLSDLVRSFHDAGFRGHFEIAVDAERYPDLSYMELLIECRRRAESLLNVASPSR